MEMFLFEKIVCGEVEHNLTIDELRKFGVFRDTNLMYRAGRYTPAWRKNKKKSEDKK